MTVLPEAVDATEEAAIVALRAALQRAAEAACGALPARAPLAAQPAVPGTAEAPLAYAEAVIADFEGYVPGGLAVLVDSELVAALESSPIGSLDVAAAVQPALDAAAEALGARIGAARTLPTELIPSAVGDPYTMVPLVGAGDTAALLVSEASLRAALSSPRAAHLAGGAGSVAGSAGSGAAPGAGVGSTAAAGFAGVAGVAGGASLGHRGLDMLQGVVLDVTVELGRTRMSVRDLLSMTPGTVLELDRVAGSPADLLVNGRLIARGEVVVVDEYFGLRVTEILAEGMAG